MTFVDLATIAMDSGLPPEEVNEGITELIDVGMMAVTPEWRPGSVGHADTEYLFDLFDPRLVNPKVLHAAAHLEDLRVAIETHLPPLDEWEDDAWMNRESRRLAQYPRGPRTF